MPPCHPALNLPTINYTTTALYTGKFLWSLSVQLSENFNSTVSVVPCRSSTVINSTLDSDTVDSAQHTVSYLVRIIDPDCKTSFITKVWHDIHTKATKTEFDSNICYPHYLNSTSWQGFIYDSVYLAYFAIAKLLLTASFKIKIIK